MKRTFGALIVALALSACGGASERFVVPAPLREASRPAGSPIQHVVIVVQENRSFDNLFDCFKGTECVKRGKEKIRQGSKYVDRWVTLTKHKLVMSTDIGHCYYAFVTAKDGGKMDGFNLEPKGVCGRSWGGGGKTIGATAYQYVDPKLIAPYWDMAQQYALADRTFQTQGSGSFTAHQDLIRGASSIASNESLVDTPDGMPWGCDAVSKKTVTDLIVGGTWKEDAGPFPCTNEFPNGGKSYRTLRDLLDAKHVSWKYYSPCFIGGSRCANKCTQCAGALLNAFDVIAPVRYGSEWSANVSMPQTKIFTDISNGTLPAVSWLIPSDEDSDHPGAPTDRGPQWVASVVNAIGESSYWPSTAIVVVWDDWGGLYDHVKPPLTDGSGGLGFRVPMIVVSAYVPRGVVSHTTYEFGSILRYVENNWSLGSLGTTDRRSASIGDVFDYRQKPRPFTKIPSNYSPRFFADEPPSSGGDPE